MFVLGIILGSFIISAISGEFKFVFPSKSIIIKNFIGGILMGIGSILGQGCLVGNGLIATAQFSSKGWLNLIFIAVGIWMAARILYRTEKI